MNRRRFALISNGLKIMKMMLTLASSVLWIVLAPSVFALEISWPLTQTTSAETPDGFSVEAIQSDPPGHPLFLGRPAPQAGVKGFQPALQDGALVFGPNTTAFAAEFWKNFKDFGFEVELKFDTVELDQTVLRVSGSWELRLAANEGRPALQFIGFREGLKAVDVSLEGIEAGKTYSLQGRMQADGTMTLESSDGESYTASLGQPPAEWVDFPDFYVGSSNPRAALRPFLGTISRLQFRAEEAP
jgi:hypothetical protein